MYERTALNNWKEYEVDFFVFCGVVVVLFEFKFKFEFEGGDGEKNGRVDFDTAEIEEDEGI